MQVSQLAPGSAFRVDLGPSGHIDYRLVYKTNCGAYVEYMKKTKKKIKHADPLADLTGEETTTTEIEAAAGATTISLGTECEPLVEEIDIDDLVGDAPRKARAKTTGGKRELKPATKRGQVVAMLSAGKTVSHVCEKLGIKRTCCMSHLSDARKFNGVTYEVSGEKVKVTI